jgi:DMSO reductase iron-sulfur subunit
MSKQYGFYFDADRCVQCRTCEVACKSARSIELGIKWRRVVEIWGGVYPDITCSFFALACMHCGKPACIEVCPTGAISKRGEDGIVVVDRDNCNGCQNCLPACPYGVPQFGDDGVMQMCDFCAGINTEPICAVSCPTEALDFGTLDELLHVSKGKVAKKLGGPTEPSIVVAGKLQLANPVI